MLADFRIWLFSSPRRLVVVSLTAIILIYVAGTSLLGEDPDRTTPGGRDDQQSVSSTNAAVPDANEYVVAAVDFTAQWAELEPGETQQQWVDRLAPLATEPFAQALATTDISTLPGGRPDGDPVVRFLAQESAMIAVPLSGGTSVLVTVVIGGETTSGPKVSDVQPNTGD